MIDMRLTFTKLGRAAYISHLDVNRLFQRAFKRSGLPVWYTQGFNPHVYLTFALPLSLGAESDCETVDFRLLEELPESMVLEKLNQVLPDGVKAVAASVPVFGAEAIECADYLLALYSVDTVEGAAEKTQKILGAASLPVEKKTKKGMKQIDLKDCLLSTDVSVKEDHISLAVRLPAGGALNINPALLAEVLKDGDEPLFRFFTVRRTGIYTSAGEAFH